MEGLKRIVDVICFKGDKTIIGCFERQILVFPVLVVLIASATFLFGGRCAAWQWWLSVGIVMAAPFRYSISRGLRCAGLFFFGLVLLKIATSVLVTPGWPDILQYHLPAIRLLVDGWNPVTMPTPDALQAFSGIDNSLMRHLFVLFMAKGCWYFCAVAYFFTNEPQNLLFPLFPFLFIPVAFQVVRLLRDRFVAWRCIGVVTLLGIVTGFFPSIICYSAIVDCAVCLGGVGLLLGMYEVLTGGQWRWTALLCESFWMCVSKQTGMASCFVFWCVFASVLLIRHHAAVLLRLAVVFVVMVSALLLVGVSPYFTSYRNYGHPLYPCMSADETLHPVYDFNAPQKARNADANAMGYFGNFVTAYVSPALARAYYRKKLGKPTFNPRCYCWGQFGLPAPTSVACRLGLWGLTLFLLVFGGRSERIIAGMCWLGIASFPPYLMGELRFTPWAFGMALPAIAITSRWSRAGRIALGCCGAYCALVIFPKLLFSGAYLLDLSEAARDMNCWGEIRKIYMPYVPTHGQLPPPSWTYTEWNVANVILLKRKLPCIRDIPMEMLNFTDANDLSNASFRSFYDYSFWVDSSQIDITRYSAHRRLINISDRRRRMMGYPVFIGRAYCMTLPRLVGASMMRILPYRRRMAQIINQRLYYGCDSSSNNTGKGTNN